MKREEQSVQFYSSLISTVQGEAAKRLCHGLANEELSHKMKLELLYDRLFYQED